MDTRAKIVKVINQMLAANESISIHSVAEKSGVSHSLIYNRYPDLKERIKELKTVQKAKLKAANEQDLINTLVAQNKMLRERVKDEKRKQDAESFKILLAHVQEVYSMYDQLLEERNMFAARLKGCK
jgi:AcrR family transcriptional regulator